MKVNVENIIMKYVLLYHIIIIIYARKHPHSTTMKLWVKSL